MVIGSVFYFTENFVKLTKLLRELSNSDGPTEKEQKQKPTGMSAQQAGIKPSNVIMADDASQTAGGDTTGNVGTPMNLPVNQFKEEWTVGKPIEHSQVDKLLNKSISGFDFVKQKHIIGEEIMILSPNEWTAFFKNETSDVLQSDVTAHSIQDAQIQYAELLAAHDDAFVQSFLKSIKWWKENDNTMSIQTFNAFINAVCEHPPIEMDSLCPIERGMTIGVDEVEKFLYNFRIGESVNFPPSGFSSNISKVRNFANVVYSDSSNVGIILRLIPNSSGRINAIRIHNLKASTSNLQLNKDFSALSMRYDYEREIIRPSGPTAKCVDVKKLVYNCTGLNASWTPNIPTYGCVYVIDLEDQGYLDNDLQVDPIISRYMNTSVNQTRAKTGISTTLSEIIEALI